MITSFLNFDECFLFIAHSLIGMCNFRKIYSDSGNSITWNVHVSIVQEIVQMKKKKLHRTGMIVNL